ncbi:ORF1 ISSen4 [Klebsiella pneumoniae]|nr:ORF1 ISSen4 [Klebsiella pneumoniae]SLW21900.1 ORF1 ISSen4 [Klebsiella pneumoniae]SYT07758.1 ORF1 ISSen4 [Klebsiella pneumoniae]
MKKRFPDEQIISILREAEAGVSVRELCRKHAISDATFIPGARSMAVWSCPRLSA